MVSHIQVAKENDVSVKEIHEKAIALNRTYFLDVFKSGDDGQWYGAIWKKEDCGKCRKYECKACVKPVYIFSKMPFSEPQYAACHLNGIMDDLQLTKEEEKKIGLTSQELSLLSKIKIRPTQMTNAQAFQMSKSTDRVLY